MFADIWEWLKEVASTALQTAQNLAPAYATCGSAAIADGPLPFGDAIAAASCVALTTWVIGKSISAPSQLSNKEKKAQAKVAAKAEAIATTAPIRKKNVIFPINPDDFNPVGLVRVEHAETKNGMLISWMDPKYNVEVFRWDENINYNNGPHYHIFGEGHYVPGVDTVPEPLATKFFPYA